MIHKVQQSGGKTSSETDPIWYWTHNTFPNTTMHLSSCNILSIPPKQANGVIPITQKRQLRFRDWCDFLKVTQLPANGKFRTAQAGSPSSKISWEKHGKAARENSESQSHLLLAAQLWKSDLTYEDSVFLICEMEVVSSIQDVESWTIMWHKDKIK